MIDSRMRVSVIVLHWYMSEAVYVLSQQARPEIVRHVGVAVGVARRGLKCVL